MSEQPKHRPIRSFVRREGRITPAQARGLDDLWPQYGLNLPQTPLDLSSLFQSDHPKVLEIGCGMGEGLLHMAENQPQWDFIGIEVHRPGVGALLNGLEEKQLTNVRIFCHDALEVLRDAIPDASLDRVLLFFPDPWPKKRHHKRRIVQPAFLELLAKKLKPGGVFHMATDWENYAQNVLALLNETPGFVNHCFEKGYSERPDYRPMTRFERRGIRLGHGVWDILFTRV